MSRPQLSLARSSKPTPRSWPFMSPLADEPEDEPQDDSPYCECGEEPTMEEGDWNRCAACGKPLA